MSGGKGERRKGGKGEGLNSRKAERRIGLCSYILTLLRSYALTFCFSAVLPFFLFSIFISSCTTRSVEPTRQSMHTIDTLFQQQTIRLKPEMDKACDTLYAAVFKNAIDSIKIARRIEIDSLVK